MITDIDLSTFKKLSMTQNTFLLYRGERNLELYHVNKGPIIFRTKIRRDENENGFLMNMPPFVELQTPLRDNDNDTVIEELRKLNKRVEDIYVKFRLKE